MKMRFHDSGRFQQNQSGDVATEKEKTHKSVRGAALGLVLTTMVLLAFGLIMLYSAKSNNIEEATKLFHSQLIWVFVGGTMGLAALIAGYRFLCRYSLVWLAGVCLLLVWAALSRPIKGARRWIQFGGFTFQPSELTKVAVALAVAWYCAENTRTLNRLKDKRGILPLVMIAGIPTILVLAGEDLGTTLLIGGMVFFTILAAGVKWYYLAIPVGFLPMLVLYLYKFDRMRWLRMTVFLNPEASQSDNGYQLWSSILALGSGGWKGVGLMASRLKAEYLPETHTDFILAITGEELGFVSIVSVIMLYTLWGFFALRITLRAADRMGLLLGWALTLGIMMQAAINIGAMSGAIPTKGMPAPFLSYGGSNMLGCMLATGILLAIAAETASPGYMLNYLKDLRRKLPWYDAESDGQQAEEDEEFEEFE